MINDIHIWELPEKTDDIDKIKDITMVHDNITLKKVIYDKLYEYFSQDYKIDNLDRYFDLLIKEEDDKFRVIYLSLSDRIYYYSDIIDDLVNKFNTNKDNIRSIETRINKMGNDIVILDGSFENFKSKLSDLIDKVNELKEVLLKLDFRYNVYIIKYINHCNDISSKINSDIQKIENNHKEISDTISEVSDIVNAEIPDKRKEMTDIINSEYDKILAIIDYYHHIHDHDNEAQFPE